MKTDLKFLQNLPSETIIRDPESLQPINKGSSFAGRVVESVSRFGQGLVSMTRTTGTIISSLFSRIANLFTSKQNRLIHELEKNGVTPEAIDMMRSMGSDATSSAMSAFFQKNPHQLNKEFLNGFFGTWRSKLSAWDQKPLALDITLDTNPANAFNQSLLDLCPKDEMNQADNWTASQLFNSSYKLIPSPSMTIRLEHKDGDTTIASVTRNHAVLAVKEIATLGLDAFQTQKVKNGQLKPHGAYAVLLEALVSPDILGDKYEETIDRLICLSEIPVDKESRTIQLPIIRNFCLDEERHEAKKFYAIGIDDLDSELKNHNDDGFSNRVMKDI